MKKFILLFLTIITILILYFFTLSDREKQSLIFDKFGFNRPFTSFYIGEMNANRSRLIYDKEITIKGYLTKQNNKFLLIQDKSLEDIKYLHQPNFVILKGKDNKMLNLEIDDHCLGHYVEAKGRLDKWSGIDTFQIVIVLGIEIDFSFPCTPTYVNGKLHKPKWNE